MNSNNIPIVPSQDLNRNISDNQQSSGQNEERNIMDSEKLQMKKDEIAAINFPLSEKDLPNKSEFAKHSTFETNINTVEKHFGGEGQETSKDIHKLVECEGRPVGFIEKTQDFAGQIGHSLSEGVHKVGEFFTGKDKNK